MSFSHTYRFSSLRTVCVLLALGASTQTLRATELTLADALRRASEKNPSLVAQRFGERAAEALIEQASLRPNPTLDVELENFLGTGAVRDTRALEATVLANQTFERGGKRPKRVALASREREVAASEFAARRAEVLTDTAAAYLQTLAAQQRLALAAEPLKLARETLAAADERVKAGAASPAESARSRAAVAAAQAEYARAETALATARAALAASWGGVPGEAASLTGRLRLPNTLPSQETLLAAIPTHPRLELQKAVVAGRSAALALERAQAAQDITVGGGVRFLREGDDAALVAGVSVPLPIRNKNQGNIRAARESLAGAEESARAIEFELRTAFATAWQELKTAHMTALNLRSDALPATEEAYEVVRRAYEQGQLPLIDVLDAQRALVALRRELLDAEIAYALALVRVEGFGDRAFPLTTALISTP